MKFGLYDLCVRTVAGFWLVTLVACSSADLCEPGDGCFKVARTGATTEEPGGDESEDEGYTAALSADCETLCTWLGDCELRLYTSLDLSCQEACEVEAQKHYYWSCEPAYRRMLGCFPALEECGLAPCVPEVNTYNECLEEAAD